MKDKVWLITGEYPDNVDQFNALDRDDVKVLDIISHVEGLKQAKKVAERLEKEGYTHVNIWESRQVY